jgi:Tfp pilus assembly PilM family ATPase
MGKSFEVIFNLGSSQVSAAKINTKANKLELESFKLIDLPSSNVGEDIWYDGVGQAFEKITSTSGFKTEASIILPGSIILSKTLRVPKVEIEKQRKVVSFELSQKMPFPLETLIWDFLVIDDDGIEQEILTFAIKPDVIDKLSSLTFKYGVTPKRFTPGPSLDYFAHFSDEMSPNEDLLFLNFGAKSTNLTFINASGYLLRSLNFGGSQLTESIASSFGTNYSKAEEIKKNISEEALPQAPLDKSTSELLSLQENFLNKYMQEISRSVVTYKRLKKGKIPKQLIITGRTIQSKKLLQHLSQSQALPIKYFDPYQLATVSDDLGDEEKGLLPFVGSETLGLATQLIHPDKSSVLNLLPDAKIRQLDNKKKLPWYLCASLILGLTPLPWFLNLYSTKMYLSKELASLNTLAKETISELEQTKSANKNLDLLVEVCGIASQHINNREKLSPYVYSVQKFLNSLETVIDPKISENTWFDTMHFVPDNTLPIAEKNGSVYIGTQNINLTGRYLVKPEIENAPSSSDERKLLLIEESGRRQEELTRAINEIEQVVKISRKVFSIEGKGDLYKRQFTHFEFDLVLDLTK